MKRYARRTKIQDKIFSKFQDYRFFVKEKDKESKEKIDCYIPLVLPALVDQNGLYCGSAASAGIINFSQGLTFPVYASLHEKNQSAEEKKGDNSDVLLEILKETKYASDGPQWSIHSFTEVFKKLNLPGCEAIKLDDDITEEEYRKIVHQNLREGYALILSCETIDHMPSSASGEYTHWVYCFGYNQDELAITHQGNYCKFSIHDLYLSNKNIPDLNPRAPGDLKELRFTLLRVPNRVPRMVLIDGEEREAAITVSL